MNISGSEFISAMSAIGAGIAMIAGVVSMFNETPFSLNVYSVLIMKLESPATIVVKLSLPTYSLSFSIIFLSV